MIVLTKLLQLIYYIQSRYNSCTGRKGEKISAKFGPKIASFCYAAKHKRFDIGQQIHTFLHARTSCE